MEHSHGSFKANSARVVRAVRETDPPSRVATLVSAPNDQNSCKKFSQIAAFA
jgi:hypothetical protein